MLSVCIPIHNERENLLALAAELETVFKNIPTPFEVVFVDDGSTDGSDKVLEGLCLKNTNFKLITFRKQSGQSAAFEACFRASRGDILITLDGDLQNDPADIPSLLAKLEEGYDFVGGWRRNRKDPILRSFYSKVANLIIRLVTRTKFKDLGCSLKVFRREFIEGIRLYGETHRFLNILIEQSGARICEVPVNHRPRIHGSSKYGMIRVIKVQLDLCTIWFMRNYQSKPIYVFGFVGLFLIFSGLGMASVTLYEKYAMGTWVHRNPLFVLSMVFTLIGTQFLGLGLLAEILIRTYFESQKKFAYSIKKKINLGDF